MSRELYDRITRLERENRDLREILRGDDGALARQVVALMERVEALESELATLRDQVWARD